MDIRTQPKVSVIIPLFNLRPYVGEAIDSVLNQTYPNIEIIVVDDGSTDNPETVLNKYKGRIELVRQENRGLSSARNTGIRNSEGEYLVFLDADDYVSPNKIEMEVETLEKYPKVGWVYGVSLVVDENKRVIRRIPDDVLEPNERPPEGNIFNRLILRCLMLVNAVIIRREVVDVGLFDESLTSCEDWDFWLRVSVKYDVKHIREPLAFVRYRPDSMSRNAFRLYSNKIRVIKKICQLYPDLTRPYRDKLNKVLADIHTLLGLRYHNEEKLEESASEFLNSIRVCPFQRRVYLNLALVVLKILGIPIPISL